MSRGDLAGTRQSPKRTEGTSKKDEGHDLGVGEPDAAETIGPPGSTSYFEQFSFPSARVTWSESFCHMINDAHEQKAFSSFKRSQEAW